MKTNSAIAQTECLKNALFIMQFFFFYSQGIIQALKQQKDRLDCETSTINKVSSSLFCVCPSTMMFDFGFGQIEWN